MGVPFNKPMRTLLKRLDEDRSGILLRKWEHGHAARLKDEGLVDISNPDGHFYAGLTPQGRRWIELAETRRRLGER